VLRHYTLSVIFLDSPTIVAPEELMNSTRVFLKGYYWLLLLSEGAHTLLGINLSAFL